MTRWFAAAVFVIVWFGVFMALVKLLERIL